MDGRGRVFYTTWKCLSGGSSGGLSFKCGVIRGGRGILFGLMQRAQCLWQAETLGKVNVRVLHGPR